MADRWPSSFPLPATRLDGLVGAHLARPAKRSLRDLGDPPVLRSLDTIHLAAALELGDELDGIVTYDRRLAECVALHGLAVIAPA